MGTLEDVISSPSVRTTSPDATVLSAVEAMCRWHVRALVVGDPAEPLGIFCERDVLERVVLAGRAPATTLVGSVMTAPLFFLPLDCTPEDALTYLSHHRVHQVPIAREEALVAVVSSSDLERWALRNLEAQVQALTSYVMSGR